MAGHAAGTGRTGRPGRGRRPFPTTVVIAVIAVGLGLGGAACSASPAPPPAPAVPTAGAPSTTPNGNPALCAAAADFQTAANDLVGLNAGAVGVDGVKAALQNLGTAASGLADAAQADLGPQVDALRQSIAALGTTITGLQSQTDLASKLGAIATSIGGIQRAAAPIMDSVRAGCPAVPAPELPTGGPTAAPTT